jgi:tyrosyl-tRNA synthetase
MRRATVATTATDEAAATEDVIESTDSSIYAREPEALAKVQSPFLTTLRDRGFLHQCTGITELDAKLMSGTQSAYLGFDATADSLHVGSLLQIMILRHLQKSGHKPVVLIGGGTSKVGDPTGKDESRVLLTDEIIQQNADGISKVFEQFLKFGDEEPTDAIMVNNDEWLSEIKYLDFLRDYGTHFTINRMLSFESVKQRLTREAPFSFLEFNVREWRQAHPFILSNPLHFLTMLYCAVYDSASVRLPGAVQASRNHSTIGW